MLNHVLSESILCPKGKGELFNPDYSRVDEKRTLQNQGFWSKSKPDLDKSTVLQSPLKNNSLNY